MQDDKRPLLLFTGGLDSSFMLYQALQKGPVDVLYVEGPQGPDKRGAELAARWPVTEKIYQLLNHGETVHRVKEWYVADLSSAGVIRSHTFGQIAPWLFGALTYVDPFVHNEVQIGYLMDDTQLVYRNEMIAAWDNLVAFSKREHVPLTFPLLHQVKESIWRHIPKELRDLTWSCELPESKLNKKTQLTTYKACGNCPACRTRKVQKYIEKLNETPVKLTPSTPKTDDTPKQDIVAANC